jgi:hypothetical protein
VSLVCFCGQNAVVTVFSPSPTITHRHPPCQRPSRRRECSRIGRLRSLRLPRRSRSPQSDNDKCMHPSSYAKIRPSPRLEPQHRPTLQSVAFLWIGVLAELEPAERSRRLGGCVYSYLILQDVRIAVHSSSKCTGNAGNTKIQEPTSDL